MWSSFHTGLTVLVRTVYRWSPDLVAVLLALINLPWASKEHVLRRRVDTYTGVLKCCNSGLMKSACVQVCRHLVVLHLGNECFGPLTTIWLHASVTSLPTSFLQGLVYSLSWERSRAAASIAFWCLVLAFLTSHVERCVMSELCSITCHISGHYFGTLIYLRHP